MQPPPTSSRIKRIMRLASLMSLVSLATFGVLVGTYKLLF
jgi:hypothetical protein